ncbi:MAG: N-acetylmuramoyl-L-alanine amidase [Lachnospiraceae bacterium]|nr:N-acetylmuramoyl-L-alanine amidase [Lachnospiraceae bacterium]
MERKEWRFLVLGSISIFCLVLLSCIPFTRKAKSSTEQSVHAEQRESVAETGTETGNIGGEETETVVFELPEQDRKEAKEAVWTAIENRERDYIKLPKQYYVEAAEAYLQEDYMSSRIILNFAGDFEMKYDTSSVVRTFGKKEYTGKLKPEEPLKKMELKKTKQKKGEKLQIIFTFEKILEPVFYETEDFYYIALKNPRDVYDRILVLDAGHGGMDEGTMSADKKDDEKTYALSVVKKLRAMFTGKKVKVYCTRMVDMDLSKAARVGLANRLQADLFVSIQCNAAEAWEHHIGGIEALYSNVPLKYGHLTSKALARIMLEELSGTTSLEKRGIIDREGLYILKNSRVPATIVEVGYMTNISDMNFMRSEKGQELIVKGLYLGIQKALKK